ncbi:MAG: molybdopterin-binding protein [Alphaproteobacteria bacterium]|nr:molybdopterin-binding protein [Alphaproteobacteria bacterium]
MTSQPLSRRGLLTAGAATFGGLLLAGCDRLSTAPKFQSLLGSAERATYGSQRVLLSGQPLAREFQEKDLSPVFKANGSTLPADEGYQAMMEDGFADWRLKIDGLVARPVSLSIADLKRLPQRTQITRHDCVEGWSAIGKWTGVPLGLILKSVGLAPNARFAVFHCADDLDGSTDGSGLYYESIDLIDAFHPQTILAHAMNGKPLEVAHGAPLRLRVERQLGYKQAKYVMRIEIVERFDKMAGGKGGFWEDRGYEWYAGI